MSPAGTSHPQVSSTNSGIPATKVVMTGRPNAKASINRYRQSLGEAREYERSRSSYERHHLAVRLPAREFDATHKSKLLDPAGQQFPQWPIADDGHLEL